MMENYVDMGDLLIVLLVDIACWGCLVGQLYQLCETQLVSGKQVGRVTSI